MTFHAKQARHNDGMANPFTDGEQHPSFTHVGVRHEQLLNWLIDTPSGLSIEDYDVRITWTHPDPQHGGTETYSAKADFFRVEPGASGTVELIEASTGTVVDTGSFSS